MESHKEVTNRVERMQAAEDRLGISFEAIFADYETSDYGNSLTVNFDVTAATGGLASDIEVVVSAYNSAGQLVATTHDYIPEDEFFGIDSKSLNATCPQEPAKIRLFAKKS
jgi:hypothetical protein